MDCPESTHTHTHTHTQAGSVVLNGYQIEMSEPVSLAALSAAYLLETQYHTQALQLLLHINERTVCQQSVLVALG